MFNDSMRGRGTCRALKPHPIFAGRSVELPPEGKLKWLGGNLGLDFPVREDVIDDKGQLHEMDLRTLLQRLDDFEGYRGNVTMKANILQCCFIAYRYNLLTPTEIIDFETYVHHAIGHTMPLEAARAILLGTEGDHA